MYDTLIIEQWWIGGCNVIPLRNFEVTSAGKAVYRTIEQKTHWLLCTVSKRVARKTALIDNLSKIKLADAVLHGHTAKHR